MVFRDIARQSREFMKHVDIFKQPVPTLTLNGKTRISTIYGQLTSIVLVCVILLYADFKLSILVSR